MDNTKQAIVNITKPFMKGDTLSVKNKVYFFTGHLIQDLANLKRLFGCKIQKKKTNFRLVFENK